MANKIIEKMDKGEKAVGISLSYYADEMVELADQHGLSVVRWPEEDDIVGRLCAACDAIGKKRPRHESGIDK